MKSIFLSMLAIAALASCTKENFNVDPPVPQGEKMLVDITLSSGKKQRRQELQQRLKIRLSTMSPSSS